MTDTLRAVNHRDILLAECLEPFADAGCKERVIKEKPGFIQDQQAGTAIKAGFEPVKQIGENRKHQSLGFHQGLKLEMHDITEGEPVLIAVKQAAPGTFERVGLQGLPQWVGLQ